MVKSVDINDQDNFCHLVKFWSLPAIFAPQAGEERLTRIPVFDFHEVRWGVRHLDFDIGKGAWYTQRDFLVNGALFWQGPICAMMVKTTQITAAFFQKES
jgi:hypothetical protein